MSDTSLVKIDLVGKLTKPLTVLVERVSHLVEITIQPWLDRRTALVEHDRVIGAAAAKGKADVMLAQSKAQVAVINAESKSTVAAIRVTKDQEVAVIETEPHPDRTDVEARAARRLRKEEVRFQENLDAVGSMAVSMMRPDIDPEAVPDAWLLHLFEHARKAGDDQARLLWAKVMAGEVNAPGSFSKKTLNVLAEMEAADAQLFRRVCGTVWEFDFGLAPITPHVDVLAQEAVLGFTLLSAWRLAELGLIEMSSTRNGWTRVVLPRSSEFASYFGEVCEGFPTEPGVIHYLGPIGLTTAGRQLYKISDPQPIPGYIDLVASQHPIRRVARPTQTTG